MYSLLHAVNYTAEALSLHTSTPYPFRVIISVLVVVGLLVNLSSLCANTCSVPSAFLSAGFRVVPVLHCLVLIGYAAVYTMPGTRIIFLAFFLEFSVVFIGFCNVRKLGRVIRLF